MSYSKLIKFKTRSKFDAQVKNIPSASIVFIEDTGEIWTHGKFYAKTNGSDHNHDGSYVKYNDVVMNTNPFGGKKLYINSINNAMYAADKRFIIKATRYNLDGTGASDISSSVGSMFNGSYETGLSITANKKVVIEFDFNPKWSGYPYGTLYLSFYHSNIPLSVEGRVYNDYEPHGIGWHTLSFTKFNDAPTAMIYSSRQDKYGLCKLELTITAKSDTDCKLTQVDYNLDRPHPMNASVIGKFAPEQLYYNLTNNESFIGKSFIKSGSDDTYILLGGGGQKAISDFSLSNHNHNSLYAPISHSNITSGNPHGVSYQNIGGTVPTWNQNTTGNAATATTASSVLRATFGDKDNGTHDANSINSNGLWYYSSNGPSTTIGASTNDGAIYSQAYSTSWVGQIAQDYRNGGLYVRGKNNGTWQSWQTVLDSRNYTNYTVTKTGTGASGTWAINITGTATNATNATNINVSHHTTNDTEYPLIWTNQTTSSNALANQLYKSAGNLLYNPKNNRITASAFKGNLIGNADTSTNSSGVNGLIYKTIGINPKPNDITYLFSYSSDSNGQSGGCSCRQYNDGLSINLSFNIKTSGSGSTANHIYSFNYLSDGKKGDYYILKIDTTTHFFYKNYNNYEYSSYFFISEGHNISINNPNISDLTQATKLTSNLLYNTGNFDPSLKANLASPSFTGTPTAPTATPGTNTDQLATTAFVRKEVSDLVGGAPESLDTLKEIADYLTNGSIAGSIVQQLASKVSKAGDTMTGDLLIQKGNAWVTLDSESTGTDGNEQGAGISIGESGKKGAAAVHLTYTGDGYGHLGMGAVSATTSLPANEAMRLFYTDNIARFAVTPEIGFGATRTKVSLEGHTHSYLPLSGGTLTGNLYVKIGASGTYGPTLYTSTATNESIFGNSINGNLQSYIRIGDGTVKKLTYYDTVSEKNIYHSGNSNTSKVDWQGSNITASNGLLRSVYNGNTLSIGSQNSSYCHIYNSANIPFYFNNQLYVSGSAVYHSGNSNKSNVSWTCSSLTSTGVVKGSNIWEIRSETLNLKVTEEWMDTGIVMNAANFPDGDGTYMIELFTNATAEGFYSMRYSGVMPVYTGASNSSTSDEIMLTSNGIADTGRALYLRLLKTAAPGNVKIQIASSITWNAIGQLTLKYKRIL